MNNSSSCSKHPRERPPQLTVTVLDATPEVNFQCGRFFLTRKDIDSRVNFLTFRLWTVEMFWKLVYNNADILINKGFISADINVFSQILYNTFIKMEPVDSEKIFKSVCINFLFEFLLMYDLFRDHAC